MLNAILSRALLAGVVLIMGSSVFAASATLPIHDSITAPTTPLVAVVSNSGNPIIDATGGGTYNYGDSLGPLSNTLYSSGGIDFNFYDDYEFTVGGAALNSITSTITFAPTYEIDNLQARLYNLSGNPVPTLGVLATGTLVTPWGMTNTAAGGVSYTVLNAPNVVAGTYVLQLRGTVTGTGGGSYAGVLNVTPVPVPAALWLMTSAVAGLGVVGRKRNR